MTAFHYPVTLDLTGRPCVVVGGGTIAEQKIRGLLEAGAEVRVIAQEATGGLQALGEAGDVELVERAYREGDLSDAFMAIAATDDGAVNARVFAEAENRRVLLNAVDDVDHCHFAAPSVVRRGDFMLTISTNGKAPALAKMLRKRLSAQFGEEYGSLVSALGEARAQLMTHRADMDFDQWAERWGRAMSQDLIDLAREGRFTEVRETVARHVGGTSPSRSGKVWVVGAGPGHPELITVRGRHALERADIVLYDRLTHPSLIEGKEAVFVGKRAGRHFVRQEDTNALMVREARSGKEVVRLKGGDPFVFGRGAEEVEALLVAGLEVEVVPAPTSAIAGLAYAGIPVTDRRAGSSVAFVTGHAASEDRTDWGALARGVDTIVIFMGLDNLGDIVDRLVAGGRSPQTPAALIENATLPQQRSFCCELSELVAVAAREAVAPPSLLVVGEVVDLADNIQWLSPDHDAPQRREAV